MMDREQCACNMVCPLRLLIVFVLYSYCVAKVPGTATLPTLNVDRDSVSVSGISSGAAMATQFHVAFSSEVIGAGMIAGAPYLCSPPAACMTSPSILSASTFVALTTSARWFLNIDATSNLKHDKVWVFAGTKDDVVNPAAGSLIYDYYDHYLQSDSQIKLVDNIDAAHGMITNNYGGDCGTLQSNYFNNCQYNAAFQLLNHVYGGYLKEPNSTHIPTGQLLAFDQSQFGSRLALMDSNGYVYVPSRCRDANRKCKLHIAFHGCQMGRHLLGNEYVSHAGYNQVADLNDIIVLYPQVTSSLSNPMGCWDWFGYTGIYYAFHTGPQMRAVHSMMKQIIG